MQLTSFATADLLSFAYWFFFHFEHEWRLDEPSAHAILHLHHSETRIGDLATQLLAHPQYNR